MDHTQIHKLPLNSGGNRYFIKRDDLLPFSFGGNKVRKAVLFFQDLQEQGCDCVVTYGVFGSNHCRIISNMAFMFGIPCYIVSPQGSDQDSANQQLTALYGASVTSCPLTKVRQTIAMTLNNLHNQGLRPYFIAGGGHGNIGTQAYVDCYSEICAFEWHHQVRFDYIFLASGTGTTQAGLVCGKILAGDNDRRIIGISIARSNPYGAQVVLDSIKSYLNLHGHDQVWGEQDVKFCDDFILGGYGKYDHEVLATISEVLLTAGIALDPVYTGKAFYGTRRYIENNNINGKNILFIHTGGTPIFFDHLGELKNV